LLGFNRGLGVGQVLSVESLAAAPALNDPRDELTLVAITNVSFAEGHLVVETAGILVNGADAGDHKNAEEDPVAGSQRKAFERIVHGKSPRTRTSIIPAAEVEVATLAA
jgi:hypothetical protein